MTWQKKVTHPAEYLNLRFVNRRNFFILVKIAISAVHGRLDQIPSASSDSFLELVSQDQSLFPRLLTYVNRLIVGIVERIAPGTKHESKEVAWAKVLSPSSFQAFHWSIVPTVLQWGKSANPKCAKSPKLLRCVLITNLWLDKEESIRAAYN